MAVIGGVATLFAQGGTKPANVGEGTVMVKGKSYSLKNAVAYETPIDGDEGIAVVVSGPTISSEKLNEARKSEKQGGELWFQAALRQAGVHEGRGIQRLERWRRRHLAGQAKR